MNDQRAMHIDAILAALVYDGGRRDYGGYRGYKPPPAPIAVKKGRQQVKASRRKNRSGK